jgi:hypothetical protein
MPKGKQAVSIENRHGIDVRTIVQELQRVLNRRYIGKRVTVLVNLAPRNLAV